jgi:hypothetical protein
LLTVDLIKLKIPATFASGKAVLSWRDLRFGIVCELLDPQAAIEFAIEQLGSEDEPAPALLELASAGRGEPVMPWVDQLAAAEAPCDEVLIRDKWLHIVLAWLYENCRTRYKPSRKSMRTSTIQNRSPASFATCRCRVQTWAAV